MGEDGLGESQNKSLSLVLQEESVEECSEKEVPRVEEVCEWYNEECKTEYVKHCENNRREKRGVLQAIMLPFAIASQNPETTEAPARVRCYLSPTTTCRHNYDGSIDGECSTTYHRYCYRARSRRSATESEDCAQVPSKRCSLIPGAQEGAGVKVCRQVNLPKLEKVCENSRVLRHEGGRAAFIPRHSPRRGHGQVQAGQRRHRGRQHQSFRQGVPRRQPQAAPHVRGDSRGLGQGRREGPCRQELC